MNRKERRAAQKQGKSGPPLAPGLSPTAMRTNLFASAVAHFRAGQLEPAERLCRDVLMFDRNHFDSLHLLGIIATRTGRLDAALELLGRAIAANDRSPECHFNLAQVFRALGRLDDAAEHLNRASALKRDYAAAHLALADVLTQQGRLDQARALRAHGGARSPPRRGALRAG